MNFCICFWNNIITALAWKAALYQFLSSKLTQFFPYPLFPLRSSVIYHDNWIRSRLGGQAATGEQGVGGREIKSGRRTNLSSQPPGEASSRCRTQHPSQKRTGQRFYQNMYRNGPKNVVLWKPSRGLSLWSMHVLSVLAWIFLMFIDDSKLSIVVSLSVCCYLSICDPVMDW